MAGKRLSTLVEHTRKLPKRLVKQRHKAAPPEEGEEAARRGPDADDLLPPRPARVRHAGGEQGIATPTVLTLYQMGEPVGRATVGKGAVDITPEVPVSRSNLAVAFEQDNALPAQKAVEP